MVGTHQLEMSCWNGVGEAVVERKTSNMPVKEPPCDTSDTSHPPIGWLKASASRNMPSMVRTLPTFQDPMGWLNSAVSANMKAVSVAALMFHPLMSRLNPSAFWKVERKLVTRDTSQFSTPARVPFEPENVWLRRVTVVGKAATLLSNGWLRSEASRLVIPVTPKLLTAKRLALAPPAFTVNEEKVPDTRTS